MRSLSPLPPTLPAYRPQGTRANLTDADIRAIRRDPRKLKEIAAEYRISEPMVSGIKRRKLHVHVPDND